jgi:heme/copper-type cytochrome/quinol oxidase subunit 2
VVLGYIGIVSSYQLMSVDTPPHEAMVVKVIGGQFYWSFEYPDGATIEYPNGTATTYPNGVTLQNVLYVKVGQVVELDMVSADVVHGFFISELGVHIDAVPGHVNKYWLRGDNVGQYQIVCALFCGTSHYAMIAQLIVVA